MKPREADLYRFTKGDCHVLARRIHRITGWPLMAFDEGDGPNYHCFVLTPSGKALDVEGLHDLNSFTAKWKAISADKHCFRPVTTTIAEIRSFGWTAYQINRYSYARARVLADRLLAHYADEAC